MDIDIYKSFAVGFAIGATISGYIGFHFGKKASKKAANPEFRMIIASVIVMIWGIAHVLSLLTGQTVDPWLNAIMGAVAGFLFGDGLVETFKK